MSQPVFSGPNLAWAVELYEQYRRDPESVDAATRALFADWSPPSLPQHDSPKPSNAGGAVSEADVTRIASAARLFRLLRESGHLAAKIDPLGSPPPGDAGLELASHRLTEDDLRALPASLARGIFGATCSNALEASEKMREVYCGSIGYETDHIQIPDERRWFRQVIESRTYFRGIDAAKQKALLLRLMEVDGFEQFIDVTFKGEKRFSLEGCDMLVPMLDEMLQLAADADCGEVVMGMAHRGRLNVLAHVLGKPYEKILGEFAAMRGEDYDSVSGGAHGYLGDVKYHLGATRTFASDMPVTLAPNPSHLEFVNPVVIGRARAAQDDRTGAGPARQNTKDCLAVLIHGDAAFPGQGVVAETLNLCGLRGYNVGGTIHIIANNQIGFTTDSEDSRSTLYASDLAKGFEIPILHVNADDPEACIAAIRMAMAYRQQFGKDFLIDLVGYRRYGHNETDEPSYTQPRMYEIIRRHPRPYEVWGEQLKRRGILSAEEFDAMRAGVKARLEAARAAGEAAEPNGATDDNGLGDMLGRAAAVDTSVPEETLRRLNTELCTMPQGFVPSPKVEKTVLATRRAGLDTANGINWGHAESLAYATLLAEGTPVRISGQDSERGTFTHRHAVLHNPETGAEYAPLQGLASAKATFSVYNSPLSETGVLGFEYGYSIHARETLVLWEAQFGDFANGAQVIIDQFLISGNAKWKQNPSLVLLLPHGYEGQGPEHSSARLERFLQLTANDNLRVVNPSTASQIFHLLRRQAALLEKAPCPLVVMTPKSLLRQPRANADLKDLTHGAFMPIIPDAEADTRPEEITRLVLCSGKVYYDVTALAERPVPPGVAVVRIEELCPFPSGELHDIVAAYPNLRECVWLQEEPRNMGAWTYVAPQITDLLPRHVPLTYVGRPESASPAAGNPRRHRAEQYRICQTALADVPEPITQRVRRSAVSHAG
jgi:2-oxoglutarate dehydrogenase E1 component